MTYRVKYWRTRRALSIANLAQISGCSSATIVGIEKHGTAPKPTTIHKLTKALGIRVEDLIIDQV